MAVVHGLLVGTDSGTVWALGALAAPVATAAALVITRLAGQVAAQPG
jgi:hypothetical protein